MVANLLPCSVSVRRKSKSESSWRGKSVRLLDPRSNACRVASRPANAPSGRLVRPQPRIDRSRIRASLNASD